LAQKAVSGPAILSKRSDIFTIQNGSPRRASYLEDSTPQEWTETIKPRKSSFVLLIRTKRGLHRTRSCQEVVPLVRNE